MHLYENVNTTNQTSPHYERHFNFVGPIRLPTCALVQSMSVEDRCDYVRATEDCSANVFFFNYYNLLYCQIAPETKLMMFLGILVLLLITAYLFMILGATADGFFCPALTVVSKMMGISENVAGVTLLAFGNGAPDFFTGMAGLGSEGRNAYSDLYSGALFVVAFVGGIILTLVPFTMPPGSCMRDLCFLLLSVLFVDYAIKSRSEVTVVESSLMLFMYFCFLLVVITDQYLVKRSLRMKRFGSPEGKLGLSVSDIQAIRRDSPMKLRMKQDHASEVDLHAMERVGWDMTHGPNYMLIDHFKESMKTIDEEEWEESGTVGRVFSVLQIPIVFVLSFLIPVVDYEAPRNGWSKLLNCIQIVVLPLFIVWIAIGLKSFLTIPILVLTLPVSVPLCLFVFSYTRTDIAPKNHEVTVYRDLSTTVHYLSLLAVVGSIVTIYGTAAEIVSILDVLGVTTYRSNSFLGCTVLAFGNSMGDLVSNIALARKGYTMMGFSACLGGPLFNSLITLGITLAYKSAYMPETKIVEGTMGENCSIFLIILLFIMLLGITTTNFVMRRSIGIIMIIMYLLFLSYLTLGEFEIIHTFGSDHSIDLRAEPAG